MKVVTSALEASYHVSAFDWRFLNCRWRARMKFCIETSVHSSSGKPDEVRDKKAATSAV